jgi:ribosomal-protein-alanine N-acetyltransferase
VDTLQIRDGMIDDLERILAIEKASFEQPWSLTSFKRELSLPFSRIAVAVSGSQSQIKGYLCRWMVVDELHVLNIAVHPDFRRRGVAAGLLEDSLDEAKAKNIEVATLEVRRSNLAARGLYRKFGFEERRLRRNYYGPGEDAFIMELRLA